MLQPDLLQFLYELSQNNNRDTRFSADKTLYKTHVSAVFTSKGKQTMEEPGYYFHLEFGNLNSRSRPGRSRF